SALVDSSRRARELGEMGRVSRALSRVVDFDQAMREIVTSARALTYADSSVIYLLHRDTDRFVIGASSPSRTESPSEFPRPTKGLTGRIIQTGEAVLVDDASRDPRVRRKVVQEGVRSFIGVRIQLEEERIGVLYVNGNRKRQFSSHDVELMQTLADHASVPLGWIRLLSKDSAEIGQATGELA